jgi:hypothetical protein
MFINYDPFYEVHVSHRFAQLRDHAQRHRRWHARRARHDQEA